MGGLPLHPLVVHAAVVLLPLSALAAILLIFVRQWRRHYAWLPVAGAAAGTLAAAASVVTGNVFAESVGLPARHATLGAVLMWIGVAFSISAVIWWFLQYRSRDEDVDPRPVLAVGIVTAVLAVITLVFTVLVGHSGAEAAWGGRTGNTSSSSSVTNEGETTTPEPAGDSGASEESGSAANQGSSDAAGEDVFTVVQVGEHDDTSSCWASIDGIVYDLTEWISQHPGGSARIERLCGTDATDAFAAQHGDSGLALQELEGLKIGKIG